MTEPNLSHSQRLAALAQRYWRWQCDEFPLNAVLAGETTNTAVLFREAPGDYERRLGASAGLRQELQTIPLSELTGQDRATHRLLQCELEDLRGMHQVLAHYRPPLLPAGPDFATISFANTASVNDTASAELYVERLSKFPAYLTDIQACLQAGYDRGIRYPKVVLDGLAAMVRGMAAAPLDSLPWTGTFRRSIVASNDSVQRCAKSANRFMQSEWLPALRAYADFLVGPLARGARDSIACIDAPLGPEFYAAQLRHYTTTTQSADEVHQLGLDEVRRLEAEIAIVAAQAGYAGKLDAYRRFLADDPQFFAASKEALRSQAESTAKRIDKRIPAFFGRIPRMTYGVESMSDAMSATMPAAYAQPNPADRSAPGIYWLTSMPAKCPSYIQLPMALHEGWPGHLMHLALMQEMDDLPAFRRHGALKYSACLEGWALYCETLGVEMGLYETPHQHYGRLEMELWRALRLVVDTGIHARGWSRDRAIDYMASRLSMSRDAITAEVNRYIGLPGQALAYQVGNLKIRELRQRAQNALGERFDLRAFHDQLMAAGPVTLPVLEEIVQQSLSKYH